MSARRRRTASSLGCLMIVTSLGCGKQEPAAAPASQASAAPGLWQPSVPAKFAGLTLKDGGACSLDVVNGANAANGGSHAASGSSVTLTGWAVADVKEGRPGSALGIQLNSGTPYYIAAESYVRPGLGGALKGSSALDAGGLKLDSTQLNVPAGEYRVIFLIQSDRALLRCDTGRSLRVE